MSESPPQRQDVGHLPETKDPRRENTGNGEMKGMKYILLAAWWWNMYLNHDNQCFIADIFLLINYKVTLSGNKIDIYSWFSKPCNNWWCQ